VLNLFYLLVLANLFLSANAFFSFNLVTSFCSVPSCTKANSTRLLSLQGASHIGNLSPKPFATTLLNFIPFFNKYFLTAFDC